MDIKNNGSQIVILKKLTIGSQDIDILEEINQEAIPECERNSLRNLMDTGATILGI